MRSASCIASWPTRKTRLGALEILTGPRVDLDLVAPFDEQRDVDAQSGLDRGRLRRAGRGVTLEPEIGLGDREGDRSRKVDSDRRALVLAQDHGHPVGEVVDRVAEQVLVERELIVGRGIHEVIVRPVAIHVLDVAVIQARSLEPVAGLEGLLHEIALTHVAQLHAHLRAAAPELDVLELDDLVEHAVELDGHAALDLTGADHALFVSSMSQRRACSYPATPLPITR